MSKITLTPGTKKFNLLAWMADSRDYTTYGEIQRFICEMSGYDYNQMTTESVYKKAPAGSGQIYYKAGTKQVRMYRGIWATNLSSGRDPILRNYCERVYVGGKYKGWAVRPEVITAIKGKLAVKKSSLEQDFKSDEIPNNSKVVERTLIRMVDETAGWKQGDNGFAPSTPKFLTPRDELLNAARLASKVNALVALQEKHLALKKEYQQLAAQRDAIERRISEIADERFAIKREVNTFFED
jgi:hypothetical protein